MSRTARYLSVVAWTVASVFVAVAAVCIATDPQRLFGTPDVSHVNARKPYLQQHRTLARWKAAARMCPTAGIFGNSRAEVGFDPEHPGFAALGTEAFNHANPGTGLALARDQLAWLRLAGCKPKVAVIGLDFPDFLVDPAATGSALTAPPIAPVPRLDLRTIVETTLTLGALGNALKTLYVQWEPYGAIESARGLNELRSFVPEVERTGAFPMFRQAIEENARVWRRRPRSVVGSRGAPAPEYAILESLIDAAAADGTRVILVTYPYHLQLRLLMARLGFEGTFESWKRKLVGVTSAARNKGQNVELWDFSLVAGPTTERIPRLGDIRSKMTGYWEAGHFKRELGDRMLDQILLGQPGFGIALDESNVDTVIREDRQRLALMSTEAGELARELDALVARGADGSAR